MVNRVLVRGTHKGEYMGIPGSGKTVEIGGIDILRMVNGKAAERWGYFDDVRSCSSLVLCLVQQNRPAVCRENHQVSERAKWLGGRDSCRVEARMACRTDA